MSTSADEVKEQAGWDGAQGQSRQVLLSSLSSKSVCTVFPFLANLCRIYLAVCHDP